MGKRRYRPHHLLALASTVAVLGCSKAKSSDPAPGASAGMAASAASSAALRERPTDASYREAPWADVAAIVRARTTRWIVQTRNRRVYLTTTGSERYVTTEPQLDDVVRLIEEVDPSHVDIGITTHDEIAWVDAEQLMREGKAIWVEQRDGRRVYLYTTGSEWLLSIEPRTDDVLRLLEQLGTVNVVKFATHEEIPWREALALLRVDGVRHLGALHGRRVYLKTHEGKQLFSVQPEGVEDIQAILRNLGSRAELSVE